jgi:hypothetical protein
MKKSDQLFSELLYLLHHNAFNAIEKVNLDSPNDSDLTNIRKLIDMVLMLKEKTAGNLTEELSQIQNMMLTELESKYNQILKN